MAHQAAPIRRIIYGTNPNPRRVLGDASQVVLSNRVASMLAQPSWSVRSLLPEPKSIDASRVNREQLHHLLKLSALPLPKSEAEERRMLGTLGSQIHFVKEVQKIDTTRVEPLVAIRDETAEAIREQTIDIEKLQPYLDQEKKVGRNGTVRRQKPTEMIRDSGWDPFEMGDGKASRQKGKFFFVRKRKEQSAPVLQPRNGENA